MYPLESESTTPPMAGEPEGAPNAGAGCEREPEAGSSSLCKAVFGADVSTPEEQVALAVRVVIQKAICKKALSLKEEIKAEMNLEKTEEGLRTLVDRLKINRTLLIEAQENAVKIHSADLRQDYIDKLNQSKLTMIAGIEQTMKTVKEIESKINRLKLCWEHFRNNYKVAVKNMLLQIQKERSKPQVQWTAFLPEIEVSDETGNKERHPMNYFE